ncbi:MAG: hypothetical protein QOG23_2495 [Blastocatellia bacterium]|jgi:hypothetical protein|nr:hypothetical protein [Blastocatellia bacterium]
MIYRMTKLLLAVSKINHLNPVNLSTSSFSACGAHWPEMALQFLDLM